MWMGIMGSSVVMDVKVDAMGIGGDGNEMCRDRCKDSCNFSPSARHNHPHTLSQGQIDFQSSIAK